MDTKTLESELALVEYLGIDLYVKTILYFGTLPAFAKQA